MATYQEVQRQVETLTPAEQLQLMEAIAVMLQRRLGSSDRSFLELEGLGKEIWQLDAQAYVDRERDSWSG